METATNITIHNITETIESNTVLGAYNFKRVNYVIDDSRVIVVLVDLGLPFINTTHSMSHIFFETTVRQKQCNTRVAPYHYL